MTNWCITEALLARFHAEQAEAEKKRQKDEERANWKKDPDFAARA